MEALLDAGPHRQEGAGGDGVLSEPPYLLVWDGDCGFCRRSVEWVLERDAEDLIEARAFQEEGVLERAGLERAQAERAAWLIAPDGERHAGARAAARTLRLLPGWKWAGWLMSLPGLNGIAALTYRWIADHRSFVSRVTGLHSSAPGSGPASCGIDSDAESARDDA